MKQLVCFVCHTNRPEVGLDGKTLLEEYMHIANCAAMWEYRENDNKTVRWLTQMQQVKQGNYIFMFANGKGLENVRGIIAVGKARTGCEPVPPGDKNRLRGPDWKAEWQVPVDWLGSWQLKRPYQFDAPNATFYQCPKKEIKAIMRYFHIPVT